MYTESVLELFYTICIPCIATALIAIWADIYYICRFGGRYEKFAYEKREWIYLKKMYRFFPCYDKQKPQFVWKKVFVLQSVWYGLILLTLVFLLASLFLEGWPRLILCAMVFFPDAGFAVYTGSLEMEALRKANMRFKLNKTNEK